MTPYLQDPDVTLYHGDVLDVLREIPAESVDCCVTSPPYWGLRDYGTPGQLGLEPTPEQYVERMVEVFREVRRVLAPHGTVWLNLGDSYAGGGPNRASDKRVTSMDDGDRSPPPGLKPKDLCGIPWRVAFALQQPYYTGRIKDERDRLWLAAMVDAEGCIHIHRRKAGTDSGAKFTKKNGETVSYARTKDTYGVMVSIDNTSQAIVDRCEQIVGQGSRYVHEKDTGQQQRKQTLYRLTLTGQQSRELLRELYPHLVAKQQEARIAYYSPSSGDEAAACHEAIKALHNGVETTVDYKAPPTLFEPGWYLRSDICWAKSNPMPESVTDRPTKAHEYVFLLSKQPRYFFDTEAVREEYAPKTLTHRGGGKAAGKVGQQDGLGKVASGNYGDWDKPRTAHPRPRPQEETLDGSNGEAPRGPDGRRNTHVEAANGSIQHRDGERWPNGGRNIRSVWEIATQPFSGRELFGGDGRIPSPDCPVHGDRPVPAPTARRGERADASSLHTPRSDDRHAQEPLDGPAPTEPIPVPDSAPSSSDSQLLASTATAIPSSTRTRKTFSRSDERDTDGEQTPDRTRHSEPSDGLLALDGFDSHDSSETPDRKSHTSSLTGGAYSPPGQAPHGNARGQEKPSCTCKYIDHFATFPEELARRCIAAGCPEGGTVLDPFVGSGTTCFVARKHGRRSIGIDLNAEYLALAAKRLGQQSLFAV